MSYKVGANYCKDFLITRGLIESFCSVTGDNNPLHADDQYAKSMSFDKIIAPGLLLGGLIASVIGNDFPGSGTIYISQDLKFKRPTFVDDIISVKVKIVDIKRNNWLVIKTDCVNQNNKVVLTGKAVVINNTIK